MRETGDRGLPPRGTRGGPILILTVEPAWRPGSDLGAGASEALDDHARALGGCVLRAGRDHPDEVAAEGDVDELGDLVLHGRRVEVDGRRDDPVDEELSDAAGGAGLGEEADVGPSRRP